MVDLKPVPKSTYGILHLGNGPTQLDLDNGLVMVAADGERFYLNDDIWIERLEEEFAKCFLSACEATHHRVHNHQSDRHLYGFFREIPRPRAKEYDGLDVLHATVSLSRLVQPTTTGDRYCAEIAFHGMTDSVIRAIQYRGTSLDVFLGKQKQRDWLSVDDGLC
jgi:hypothetical protein